MALDIVEISTVSTSTILFFFSSPSAFPSSSFPPSLLPVFPSCLSFHPTLTLVVQTYLGYFSKMLFKGSVTPFHSFGETYNPLRNPR